MTNNLSFLLILSLLNFVRIYIFSFLGTKSEIFSALSMIREQFPEDMYSDLSLTQINCDLDTLKAPQIDNKQHKVSNITPELTFD